MDPALEVLPTKKGPFKTPVRKVLSPMDMAAWEGSEAYANVLGFIVAVNSAIKGRSMHEYAEGRDGAQPVSEQVQAVLDMLAALDAMVDEVEPVKQPMRFGNKAFVTWLDAANEAIPDLLHTMLETGGYSMGEAGDGVELGDGESMDPVVELAPYLGDSFGNRQRRDYGTGHEMYFVAFLAGLAMIGYFSEDDLAAVAFRVFATSYLGIVRKLQVKYSLEPAGSRGAFGLDDYQFMPFLWGAAQLREHPFITPKSVRQPDIVEMYASEYMYLAAIRFASTLKQGPFEEHSSYLYSISNVIHWTKISGGMIKMYKGELLSKFPVIQHFTFGTIMSFDSAANL